MLALFTEDPNAESETQQPLTGAQDSSPFSPQW